MTIHQNTFWEQFLQPLFSNFLINEEELKQLRHSINWEQEIYRFCSSDFVYPDYYKSQAFHGIKNGYLTPDAAVTYDPITQYVLPPNEKWVRQALIETIQVIPQRILDLGCGTGSTTVLLQQAFPDAEVIGIDLSPYMLLMAERKAKQEGFTIQWLHKRAEDTHFSAESFDLVTASLLFHETPVLIAQKILQEAFRLLRSGGQMIVLDGHQHTLRQTEWLTNIFEEPYIKDYAQGSIDAWMGKVGFEQVKTEDFWFLHQITQGIKPLGVTSVISDESDEDKAFYRLQTSYSSV